MLSYVWRKQSFLLAIFSFLAWSAPAMSQAMDPDIANLPVLKPMPVADIGWAKLPDDVNGDGISDLFWFNDQTHQFAYWELGTRQVASGDYLASTFPVFGRVGWKTVAVTPGYYVGAISDFDGDGKADLIWTSANHDLYLWTLGTISGSASYTSKYIGNYPKGWKLIGSGDIDGDGLADLVWYDETSCQVGYWIMDKEKVQRTRAINVACGYRIIGLADVNSDHLLDLVWEGPASDVYIWYGDGSGFTSKYAGAYINSKRTLAFGRFDDYWVSSDTPSGLGDRFDLLVQVAGDVIKLTRWVPGTPGVSPAQFWDSIQGGRDTTTGWGVVGYLGPSNYYLYGSYYAMQPLVLDANRRTVCAVGRDPIWTDMFSCTKMIHDLSGYPADQVIAEGTSFQEMSVPEGWNMIGDVNLLP